MSMIPASLPLSLTLFVTAGDVIMGDLLVIVHVCSFMVAFVG